MTWEQIKHDWQHVTTEVMRTWGRFSEDDLAYINGDRERFVELYAQRYGSESTKAASRVDDFASALTPPASAEGPALVRRRR
ncbi:MAG: CsbD family protein [Planctomycetota bacterium]